LKDGDHLSRQAQDEGNKKYIVCPDRLGTKAKQRKEKRRTAISTKSEESCWSGSTYLLESRPSPSITSRYLLLREREREEEERDDHDTLREERGDHLRCKFSHSFL